MSSRFKAAIFDLDGTLVDTESLATTAGLNTAERYNFVLDAAYFESLAGIYDEEQLRRITLHLGIDDETAKSFFADWTAETFRLMELDLPLKAGARELLLTLKDAGLPFALCTSSRRASAAKKLASAKLEGLFSALICFEDVTSPKPNPDPYLRAAAALGVPPEECIAFEDSEVGAEAASKAGIFTVQVPDLHPSSGQWPNLIASNILEGAREAGLI